MAGSRFNAISRANWAWLGPAFKGLSDDLEAVESGAAGAAAGQPWVASTAYAAGDIRSYAGGLYRRKTAGTSGLAFDSAQWDVLVAPSSMVAKTYTTELGGLVSR